jgi:O-antigen/teichoic acid export membrane protein
LGDDAALFRISDKLQLIGSSYLQQMTRVITFFVMCRFLKPDDRGIFMSVIYVAGLVMALGDFVVAQSVVQIRDHDEDEIIDTGLIFTSVIFIIYGLAAVYAGKYLTDHDKLHNPQYFRIGIIVAISNYLSGIYAVQLARLNRRLEFRAESQQNIIFALSTAITGIIFAVLHYGAYAFALQVLAGQLAANIAINFRVPLSWPRRASWTVTKRLLKLGTPVSIATYVRVVEGSITGLIIRPIQGDAGVGLWSQAIQMQQMFGQNLLVSFQRVAYPLMCRSLSDEARTRALYARITLILMLISLLFTATLGVNSGAIVRVFCGKDWMPAAPLLQITAWAIPAGALDMVGTILCMALGVTKIMVRSAVINLVLFIPASLVVRHFGGGLLGLAVCWSASRYLLSLATVQAASRQLHTGVLDLWKPLTGLLGAALLSAAAMVAVRTVAGHLPLIVQFLAAGFIGLVIYTAAVWQLEPATLKDSINMARGGSPKDTETATAAGSTGAEPQSAAIAPAPAGDGTLGESKID